jgi:uroporphyrinogen decarboxylase
VGIDGKHSYEDAIQPIEQAHERWGEEIACLGGVDVDLLTRGSEDQVRTRVRQIVEACAPRGRFALGSGNSIASYVPAESYLAMLDQGLSMSGG